MIKLTGQQVKNLTDDLRWAMIDHWDTLPIISKRNREQDNDGKLKKSSIRSEILDAFSQGIVDQTLNKKRHVMSVNEIFITLTDNYNEDVSKSSVYYHLQKLIESEQVEEVLVIQEQNILTSYYSRTSKLVYYKYHMPELQYRLAEDKGLIGVLKKMNPSEGIDIVEFLTELDEKRKPVEDEFYEWLHKNEDYFKGVEMQFIQFYQIFIELIAIKRGLTPEYSKLSKLLRLD